MDEIARLDQQGWDRPMEEGDVWTRRVWSEAVDRARNGDWTIILTPNKPVPREWFGEIAEHDVLCLASGGGEQGPVLAAAGGRVTDFDASPGPLAQDRFVADRDRLVLTTREGLMHDLSCFADASFDLIFHPASKCFAPEIEPVWRECFRTLRPGGALLAGFMNPDVYLFDIDAQERDEMVVRFPLPFADITDLPQDELHRLIARDHVVEFSHSLQSQIGGQLAAGFVLTHLFEDTDRGVPRSTRPRFMPTAFATRAVKP